MNTQFLFLPKVPILLIILFSVQGVIFAGIFPLYEGWDEPAHLAYVQHIAERKELPDLNDQISNEVLLSMSVYPLNNYMKYFGKNYTDFWNDFNYQDLESRQKFVSDLPLSERTMYNFDFQLWEAQLPPMGYLPQVPVYLLFYDQDIFVKAYALRLFSVLVTAVSIVFAYKTVSLIFEDRFIRIGSLMFIVFNPMFTVNIARVNNEAITILLFSIFLFLMVRYLKGKTCTTNVLLIGLVLGLGLLAKPTFASAFVLVPIFIFLKHIQKKNSQPKIKLINSLKNLAIVFGITIPMVSWWYFKRIASGNFSGIDELSSLTIEEYIQGFYQVPWASFYQGFFNFFWGVYGWSFHHPSFPYFEVIMIFVGICIVGLVYGIVKKTKTYGFRIFRNWKYQSIFALALSIFFIIIGQSFISIQSYVTIGTGIVGGWYLFITITAISMIILLGFRTLIINSKLKNIQNELLLVSFVILIIFYVTTFYWLLPKYYLVV